ncbi:MAG TPA: hypothetical protein VMU05_05765 [Dongiaceae bacterium]|nr:hypothetical protein [Dongiaceae bacterium]
MATMATPTAVSALVQELHDEASITKRILERVPADKLIWKPHEKSMTLGQLAGHIASIPGGISRLAAQDSFDVLKGSFIPPQPTGLDEILTNLEQSIRAAEESYKGSLPRVLRQHSGS